MDTHKERSKKIVALMKSVTDILGSNPSVASLKSAQRLLQDFAKRRELFPAAEFPWPTVEEGGHCYCLFKDKEGRSLYLDLLRTGANTVPHDHGNSWAMVACIEGKEKHSLYVRSDGRTGDGKATLEHKGELTISPGESVALMVGGIHSIEAVSSEPAMMLHCYAKAFEQQKDRLEFDLEKGTCVYSAAAAGVIEDYPLHQDASHGL